MIHVDASQDKTFGLKNKKGAKNQKFIAQVQNQVQNAGKSAREVRLRSEALVAHRTARALDRQDAGREGEAKGR